MAETQTARDMRKSKKALVDELSTLRARLSQSSDTRIQGWAACAGTLVDAFLVTSANGQHLIYTNAAGYNLLEIKSVSETEPMSSYVHAIDRAAMRDRILRVQKSMQGEVFEATRFVDGNGETFYAEGSVSPEGEGDELVLKWMVRDVSKRVAAQFDLTSREREQREKAKFFDVIVNEIPAIITVKDKEGRYIYINRQMQTIKDPENLTGSSLSDADTDIENSENRKEIDRITRRVIETGEPVSNLERNGYYQPEKTWLTNIVPIKNESGSVEQVVTISNDITARKAAEAELLQKNQLLQTMIDYIPAAIALRGLDGRYIMANREATEKLGVKGQNIVGLTAKDVMPPAVAAAYDAMAEKACSDGEIFTGVERQGFQNPDLTYALTTVPVRGEDGEINGALSITVDISERKRAEAALAEKSAILNVMFENLPAQISLKDSEGRYLLFNDYLKGKGRLSDEYRGKTVFELHGTESARKIDELTLQVIASGEPILGYERSPSYMSGIAYSSDFVPVKDETGCVQYVVMLSKDVTDVKKAQRELEEKSAILQALFDNLPATAAIRSASGELLLLNKALADVYGKPVDELIGKNIEDIVQDNRMAFVTAEHLEVLETGKPVITERAGLNAPDGSPRSLMVTKFPVKSADGVVHGVGTISTDITRLKNAEAELAMHRDQLQELVHERTRELESAQAELLQGERAAAIGHLTASVSHELRNPLGTIRTSFQIVRLRLGDDIDAVAKPIDRIERNIERCVNIIEELLNYTEGSELEPIPVDIDAWCTNLATSTAAPAGVQICTDMQSSARPLIDWDRMGGALQHLIRNAVQSVGEADANENAPGVVTVSTRRCNGSVEIAVSDNGPGVPADIRHKVFEPLVSSKVYGVGLGLPIVRQTVEMHGGSVSLREPRANETGATFVIELPLKSA